MLWTARQPRNVIPHNDGSVHRNGAGGRLGDGRKVHHFLLFDPAEFFHELSAHQRNDDEAAAERERAQFKSR